METKPASGLTTTQPSSVSKAAKQPSGSAPLTAEEKTLLAAYRRLSRWDRNCLFMILQSLAYGSATSKTDRDS